MPCFFCQYSEQPQHWSLLTFARQPELQVFYADHLQVEQKTTQEAAQAALTAVLPAGSAGALPARCNRRYQPDGWSCGLWIIQQAERQLRQHMGFSQKAFVYDTEQLASGLQDWLMHLLHEQSERKAVKAVRSEPPPLPPPAAPPEGCQAVGAGSQTAVPPAGKKAGGQYGCAKCRQSKTGCLNCNPAKQMKWAEKYLRQKD